MRAIPLAALTGDVIARSVMAATARLGRLVGRAEPTGE